MDFEKPIDLASDSTAPQPSAGTEASGPLRTAWMLSSQMGRSTDAQWTSLESASPENPVISLRAYLEKKFIPDHVESKSAAGRVHYNAILKHILRPETVDSLFAPYVRKSQGRLRAVDGWPYLDDLRLCDLNADHLRQITTSAIAHGYSPQTVKHIKSVMNTIISHAQKERMFAGDNPMNTVELPPMKRRTNHTLTMAQARMILRLMTPPIREMALLAISTGMTKLEISALQWKNVNLTSVPVRIDGATIPPRSAVLRKQPHFIGTANYGFALEREFKLPNPLLETFSQWRMSGQVAGPDDLVFPSGVGSPVRPMFSGNQQLKRIGQELGMPWLSWQVLRRTHESLLSDLRIKLASALAAEVIVR